MNVSQTESRIRGELPAAKAVARDGNIQGIPAAPQTLCRINSRLCRRIQQIRPGSVNTHVRMTLLKLDHLLHQLVVFIRIEHICQPRPAKWSQRVEGDARA